MGEPEHTVRARRAGRDDERGALLVTVLVVMLPLLVLVASATTVMTGRNARLLRSVQQTKALLAAEAGIEEAAQMANAGTLVPDVVVERDLGNGLTSSWVAVSLSTDDDDNDDDGLTDEADERAFEVVSTGSHAHAVERLCAVLVEPDTLPTFRSAILALGEPDIDTKGSATVSGYDVLINGSRNPTGSDVAGIATEPPHDTAGLDDRTTSVGGSTVTGTPVLDTTPAPYNLPGLVAAIRNSMQNFVPPGTLNTNLGSASSNNFQVSYCPGDLTIAASRTGAGILLVGGNLDVSGSMRFDGLVVVLGNFKAAGSAQITGSLIQGHGGEEVTLSGRARVLYSSEALSRIRPLLRPAFGIVGWREVGR